MTIENADKTRSMTDETYSACARYLERLAAAEYKAFVSSRKRKTDRYQPTPYHCTLVRLLGARDEERFKAIKALEGYASALGC
jgi:hypothetical protein